jgi:hypothetical protein
VLRACNGLLKPGGRLAFTTIYVAPGVSERDYRRASRVRGPGIAERRAMTDLLEAAGFVDIRERDATASFARSTAAHLRTATQHERALRKAWGDQRFDDSQHDRRSTLELIRDGVVRRGIFTARRA